jgi:hypothetical protein
MPWWLELELERNSAELCVGVLLRNSYSSAKLFLAEELLEWIGRSRNRPLEGLALPEWFADADVDRLEELYRPNMLL